MRPFFNALSRPPSLPYYCVALVLAVAVATALTNRPIVC